MHFLTVLLALQAQIPAPTGYVSDFAGIISRDVQQAMTAVIREVREKSGGEIAVVTMSDLGGRESIDLARDIGREWEVGAEAEAGNRSSNAGVVMLLIPGQRPGDGAAHLAIATGRGSEGFITDAETFRIRERVGQAAVESNSYARGLLVGVELLALEYADEFGFELTGAVSQPVQPQQRRRSNPLGGLVWIIVLIFIFLLGGGRRRGGLFQFLLISSLLGGGRYRGGGFGGGFGGGGFGGGGFGGFGGGGGFSGGGSSGSF